MTPNTLPPAACRERRIGNGPHETYFTAAIDERNTCLGETAPQLTGKEGVILMITDA